MPKDDLPNGWHYRLAIDAYQFWWESRVVHSVNAEAWDDFNKYMLTPSGQQWAKQVVAEVVGA